MKTLLKKTTEMLGGHLFSRDSLPTGVHWLRDIERGLALDPSPVCFDVGANVGQTVAAFRQAFADARIHAFEPFATPRTALLQAHWADKLVHVVPRAMGSAPGCVQISPHPESQMSSLRAPASLSGLPVETIEVDTLDNYCEQQGVACIDVLKTDTEGYDHEVLRGAEGLLARQRIGYVYVEVSFMEGDAQHTPFQPVLELLQAHRYRFLGLYETYPLHYFEESSVYCNALFVSSSMRERSLQRRRAAATGEAPSR
jgi:FkbM family methyltransferase